ncbi:MAG: efflux RND transporter permease subunit, partial [Gammaproteobacteria bacterium]
MLAWLVRVSIERSGVVVALAALLLAYGSWEMAHAGLDIFPEFSPRQAVVQTEAPGLSAQQVEVLVTRPVEAALGGAVGLERLRSESIQGLSIVTAVFADDTDVYRMRQMVGERIAGLAAALPPGAGPPVVVPLASSSATVLTIGVTAAARDPVDLRAAVDTLVVPRLLAVPGVADVNVFGAGARQLQIRVDPQALRRHGLGLDAVAAAAAQALGRPGAGFIENDNQRIVLQAAETASTPDALGQVVLARSAGANVLLRDVAGIAWGAEPAFGAAAVGAARGVVMMVIGQYGANTLTVSRAVESALSDLAPALEGAGMELHPALFRPANYIETSLRNIRAHLLVGAGFVMAVLFLFLFDLRTALISAVAIPLSLVAAVVALLAYGVNLNVMIIGGLAIALGEVVDDAIIDTENIFRRLRENSASGARRPVARVVFDASLEVRGSVVYASFIVALAFVPLLTLSGVTGRLFAPVGIAYILAILASLAVALTVTPALCHLLLARRTVRAGDPPLVARLRVPYARVLGWSLARPRATLAASLAACALGVALLPGLQARFLPELREGHYIVHTASAAGTSLEESLRLGARLTAAYREIAGVRSTSQWAGRASRGADTYGPHYSEYEIDLDPASGSEQQRILDSLRATAQAFPGIQFETETFLTERVNETISGYTSPVVVNLYGTDLARLDEAALALAARMQALPGASGVQVRSPPGAPTLAVVPRLDDLALHGVRPGAIGQALRIAFEGGEVGRVTDGDRAVVVSVILPPDLRRSPEHVAALPIATGDGGTVPLSALADVRVEQGRYNVLHQAGQRVQTVSAAVVGRDLDEFMADLRRLVHETLTPGSGLYPEFTGAAVEQAQARTQIVLHALLAGVGVLLLAYVAVGSTRHALLMLVNLPFALVGGVVAAYVSGGVLSIGSMVGFVTLFGITIRNSIMMVSHFRHLVEAEGRPWNAATALQGAQERLPSVLMTALVTALAMLPIAIGSDNPGR